MLLADSQHSPLQQTAGYEPPPYSRTTAPPHRRDAGATGTSRADGRNVRFRPYNRSLSYIGVKSVFGPMLISVSARSTAVFSRSSSEIISIEVCM